MEKEIAQPESKQKPQPKPKPPLPTMFSPKTDKLIPVLIAVQKELKPVSKKKAAHHYNYAPIEMYLEEALPVLSKNNCLLTQNIWPDENGVSVMWSYIIHSSGQWVASQMPIDNKSPNQQKGQDITYGRRYLLGPQLGMCGVEEDNDGVLGVIENGKNQVSQPKPDGRYPKPRR